MPTKIKKIAIIGDGGWGTALALHLDRKGYQITLWGALKENIQAIRLTRLNLKFLPGIRIPANIELTDNLSLAIAPADLVILAIPSQYLADTVKKIKGLAISGKIFISGTKGIDTKTLQRMSQIILKELGNVPFAVLSGPTIAREVAEGFPSTAVVAARNAKLAKRVQAVFNSETFRIYTNLDVIGVELGGSLKNVVAIGCGVCDGLGYGTNTKAAILSRGLVEMARLGKVMGAKEKTFYGLASLGDLLTTCYSHDSRNRYVGEELGKGKRIDQIVASMSMVAEGVATVKAVYKLSQQRKVPMPITTEVYNIIYRGKTPQQAVADLMRRELKPE